MPVHQKVCICWLDDKQYGFAIENIVRIIRAVEVTQMPNAGKNTLGLFNFQGTVLPLMSIRNRLGLPEKEIDIDDRFIIFSVLNCQYAIAVDSVLDVVVIDDKNASVIASSTQHISTNKVARLTNGIAYIFDIEHLFSSDEIISADKVANVDIS